MKIVLLLFAGMIVSFPSIAQRSVPLHNLWTRPQVHVLFQGYTISFTIKDINKSLGLLAETGDSTYGLSCGLDTSKNFTLELFPGTKTEYRTPMQPLMQNAVGVFLLLAGRAYIENPKHKKLTEIVADIQPNHGSDEVYVLFSDPQTKKLLFSGKMPVDIYNLDLGLD